MHQIEAILRKYGLAEEEKVQEMRLEDGTTVKSTGQFNMGDDIYVENEEGESIPLPTGEYVTEDGTTIEVEDGQVVGGDVVDEKVETEEEEEEMDHEDGHDEEEMDHEEDHKEDMEDDDEEKMSYDDEEMNEEEEEEMEEEDEEKKLSKQLYSRREVQDLLRKVVKDISADHRKEVAMLKKRIRKQKESLSKPSSNRVRRRALRQEDPTKQYEPKAMGTAYDVFNQYK